MGGRNADTAGSDFVNPFEFNPGTNAWATKVAAYPDNQVNNMACGVLTVSGTPQIYCVGGSAAGATTATARVFSYNPVTDTITPLAAGDNWPGNAGGNVLPGGFAVAGNKLYLIGGFTIGANATAQTWQFDPTLGVGAKWLQRQDLPVPRGYVPAATIGGIIYTGGGSDIVAGVLTDNASSFKFDPVANAWTPITNIPRATGETRAVVMNGTMWVLGGGRTAPNPSNQVNIYDPVANSWSIGLPFTTARRNFPADSDGTSRIFLAGGYDVGALTPLNTMEIFGAGACADADSNANRHSVDTDADSNSNSDNADADSDTRLQRRRYPQQPPVHRPRRCRQRYRRRQVRRSTPTADADPNGIALGDTAQRLRRSTSPLGCGCRPAITLASAASSSRAARPNACSSAPSDLR